MTLRPNLTPILRLIVLVGKPALGASFNFKSITLNAAGRSDKLVVRLLGAMKPRRALGYVVDGARDVAGLGGCSGISQSGG